MLYNETIEYILQRRTVREYTDKPLSREQIETLLECAKWAPSGRNGQPCTVRCVSDRGFLDKMNTAFKDFVGWDTPAYTRWDKNPFYHNAPAVFFIFTDSPSDMDAGIMTGNIVIAAQSMGLNSCIIGSVGALFSSPTADEWKNALSVEKSSVFAVAVAVGYGDEAPPKKPRRDERFTLVDTDGAV